MIMRAWRKITFEKFKDVAMYSWEQYMRIDLTDYYQFVGFKEFLEYFWEQFDSKRKYRGEIQSKNTAKEKLALRLKAEKKEGLEVGYKTAHKEYKRLFWKIYIKD